MTRRCRNQGCDRNARHQGTLCERCHKRQWRAKTHAVEPQREYTDAQTQLRRSRAYVASLVKRGKLIPAPCSECAGKGLPHFPDPTKPREVVWLCRAHRTLRRQTEEAQRQDFAERMAQAVRRVRWDELKVRFAAEWPSLPDSSKSAVKALAAQDPRVKGISLESPLARQALLRAFGEWINGQRTNG